jgi:hypothetical protein
VNKNPIVNLKSLVINLKKKTGEKNFLQDILQVNENALSETMRE